MLIGWCWYKWKKQKGLSLVRIKLWADSKTNVLNNTKQSWQNETLTSLNLWRWAMVPGSKILATDPLNTRNRDVGLKHPRNWIEIQRICRLSHDLPFTSTLSGLITCCLFQFKAIVEFGDADWTEKVIWRQKKKRKQWIYSLKETWQLIKKKKKKKKHHFKSINSSPFSLLLFLLKFKNVEKTFFSTHKMIHNMSSTVSSLSLSPVKVGVTSECLCVKLRLRSGADLTAERFKDLR